MHSYIDLISIQPVKILYATLSLKLHISLTTSIFHMKDFVAGYISEAFTQNFWIGLQLVEGEWVWSDGSTPGPDSEDIV